MASCDVSGTQAFASSVSGNIGTLRSKVLIWDHDPLLARPHQQLSFALNKLAFSQMPKKPTGITTQVGAAFLNPLFIPHHMFVGTFFKDVGSKADGEIVNLDLVGTESEVKDWLPGGEIYNTNGGLGSREVQIFDPFQNTTVTVQQIIDIFGGKDAFPHQLWLYTGSLLRSGVLIHPSEYATSIDNIKAIAALRTATSETDDVITVPQIQAAPRWRYSRVKSNGINAFSPHMETKQTPDSRAAVHWTLEKFAPLWQGEDFAIIVDKGSKRTDESTDNLETADLTNIPQYLPLMFNMPTENELVQGISNEAFFIPPKDDVKEDTGRKAFWWKHKTYILIEIGANHPRHNYFIEIVKGRNPRFLHLGEEWDHPDRLGGGELEQDGWRFIRKCRVLSVYDGVSGDALFERNDFSVYVRNQLGRIVVTFQGHEDNPWVITRQDNIPNKFDFSKQLGPMVVPAAKIKIHGGNISTTINFSPVQYIEEDTIRFDNREADTQGAKNEDLYMTFSSMGSSIKHTSTELKRQFFLDPRLGFGKVGYLDIDAHTTLESNKNTFVTIPVYEKLDAQFRKQGKGWVFEGPTSAVGDDRLTEEQKKIRRLFGPHHLGLGLIPGREHKLEIVNLKDPGSSFRYGLTDDDGAANYPYKDFVSQWDVGIRFKAGSVVMPVPEAPDITVSLSAEPKEFINYVTPICGSWRLLVLAGGKPIEDNIDTPLDISELVTSIRDSWSAEGYTTMNHEMQITAYIPLGIPIGGDPDVSQQASQPDLHSLGQDLLKLHNQNFYLSISYWWEDGIGHRDVIGNKLGRGNVKPENSDMLIQMTGIAWGAEVERVNNRLWMHFTVKDYMSILKNQFIFNSPFFDAVTDTIAIYELAKMCHLDDNKQKRQGVDRRVLGFLQNVIENVQRRGDNKFIYNGEQSRVRRYDLPGSFADLANPAVKFQDGETYESAMKKIAAMAGNVLYFDRWGVLRYETSPAFEAAFQSAENRLEFEPVFDFRTSPFRVAAADPGAQQNDRFIFDPDKHAAHLVYNTVKYSRSVEDCINQIVLLSVSTEEKLADGSIVSGFIIEGYTFFDQIWDPSVEGWIGFRKPFYQSNGVFGGIEGVRNGVRHYARMKFPPASITFETYGVPLRANDIIQVNGETARVVKVNQTIGAEKNQWWMQVETEKYQVINASRSVS